MKEIKKLLKRLKDLIINRKQDHKGKLAKLTKDRKKLYKKKVRLRHENNRLVEKYSENTHINTKSYDSAWPIYELLLDGRSFRHP